MIRNPSGPKLEVAEEDVGCFVDFLDRENLHSFFWRLRSFEDHALRGNEFAMPGMQSDVQGMAVVVEHITRALGGTRSSSTKQPRSYGQRHDGRVLKRTDIARLAHRI